MAKKSSSKDRKSLIDWVDVLSKTGIAIAGLSLSYIGYIYQKSSTASELLLQQEKGDTEIRAEMFGKITERLMRSGNDNGDNDKKIINDALLVQVLALNFHELIELKPLMISLDNELQEKSQSDNDLYSSTRSDLKSVTRRIRDRQLSSLMRDQSIEKKKNKRSRRNKKQEKSNIQYITVGINENPTKSNCKSDYSKYYNSNICFKEAAFIPDINQGKKVSLSIISADWISEKFTISMQSNLELPLILEEPTTKTSKECDQFPSKSKNTSSKAGLTNFKITNYDLPFTDNTLKSDGRRYAVFIDKICKENSDEEIQSYLLNHKMEKERIANKKEKTEYDKSFLNQDFPKELKASIRIGILYFPEDYYPSRERPVRYKQLSKKLSWDNI